MRTTTLYNLIKASALLGVAMLLLAVFSPASAMNKVIDGVGLKEPLEIRLDFSESDYLLITASQSHADYSLSLVDRANGKRLQHVSLEYEMDLDEVLLVSRDACKQCTVILEAVSEIDKESLYELSIQPLVEPKASTILVLNTLNEASALNYRAGEAENEDATRGELEKVVDLLTTSTTNGSKSEDLDWRHRGLIVLADVQRRLEQYDAQRQTLNEVISETENKISRYRSIALYELAEIFENTAQILDTYDQLISNAQLLNDWRLVALGSMGKAVILVEEARFKEAITLLQYADEVFARRNNSRELLIALHNLSWANQRAGNLPESLRYASQQQLLSEALKDQENTVWALYNFAMTYRQMGDAIVADKFLDDALKILSSGNELESQDTRSLRAFLTLERAQSAFQFGAFDLASDYASRAKKEFETLGKHGQTQSIKFIQGEISMARGNYAAARNSFLETILYNKKNNRGLLSGLFLLRLVELEMIQANYIDAATHQAQALKILSETEDYKGLAKAFSQTIELLFHLGALNDAQTLANRVGAFIERYSLDQEKAKFAYRQALLASNLGQIKDAIAYLDSAMSIIEATLPKVRRRDLRQTYLALQKSVFELNIEITLKANSENVLQSLVLAERFRTRTLKEKINSIDSKSGVDGLKIAERESLLERVQEKAVDWHTHNDDDRQNASQILEQTRALSLELQKLETEIEVSRQKNLAISDEVNVDRLPVVQPNELIAYYFIGKRESWLWVLTTDTQKVYPLPAEKKIEPFVARLLEQVVVAPSSRANSDAWSQVSAVGDLSDIVLAPLEKHLAPGINLITIVSDGLLQTIPFAPLQLPNSDGPLVLDYSIVQAPSLMAQESLRRRALKYSEGTSSKALVVADPISSEKSNLPLARLEYSAEEAAYIESHLRESSTVLMSENAQKREFLKQLSQPYSILHFATHGLLNSQEPALSGLVFSESEDGDRLWLAPEISRAKIKANLVVLSACESSIGKSVSGEGLFSLGRAFIEAGANQVVGTLWKVQDQATSKLVDRFYYSLANGDVTVAQALQQAQKAIYQNEENDWSDPYYWAGFQLQGGGVNQVYASSH